MKRIWICLAVFLVIGAVLVAASIALTPISKHLAIDYLRKTVNEYSILTLSAETDEGAYVVSPSADFAKTFSFNTWETCKKQRNTETLFVLHLGPQVTLTFSPDGYVAARDNHPSAARGQAAKADAYYSIPSTTTGDILAYIQEHGIPQT